MQKTRNNRLSLRHLLADHLWWLESRLLAEQHLPLQSLKKSHCQQKVFCRASSVYSREKKAYTALLQCRTFLCRKKWGPLRNDFGGRCGLPGFHRVFVSTTGVVVVVYVFFLGPTTSTAGIFWKKFRKNSGKTPKTLSERFLENVPREYG